MRNKINLLILYMAFITCIGISQAQDINIPQAEPPLQMGGILPLIGDKLKESRGAALVTLDAKPGGGLYLPIWTLHNATDDLLELGGGGKIKQGENVKPLVLLGANLPGISSRIWSAQWSQTHVTRTKFPPIWAGPYVDPLPSSKWTWKKNVGFYLSVHVAVPLK